MRLACVCLIALAGAAAAQSPSETRVERLNGEFLDHVRALGPSQALAAGIIAQSWETYRQQAPDSFVPDALAVLYPGYRDGLAAFDAGRFAEARTLFEPLRADTDPYLAANANYFSVRSLVEQGLLEEAETELVDTKLDDDQLAKYTPYAAHLRFVQAYCQASDLRFDEASRTLHALAAAFPDAPEPVRVGVQQLQLEIERRERGTLDEVAGVMTYSAVRLSVADATERVRTRQGEAVALLDRLIQQTQEQEKQQQQGGGRRRSAQDRQARPRAGADKSMLPDAGAGQVGPQHAAPRADPGEMWGRLPPAEREKILQSLRDRFPSRYRQLVEQYYRSLAEEQKD